MFKGLINDKLEIILKEFQVVLTAGYLILIIIGMIFEATHYAQFDINIFNYSGILDFLLVPFQRPIVLITLFGTSILIYFMILLDDWLKSKFPKFYNWTSFGLHAKGKYYYIRNISFALLYLILLYTGGQLFSENFKEELLEKDPDVRIVYNNGNNNFIEGKLVGKNESYIFLLSRDKQIEIIPINAFILKITRID